MKRICCIVVAVALLVGSQGCDSNTKSGEPKLQNPSDPKIKAMKPATPGAAGKPAPRTE